MTIRVTDPVLLRDLLKAGTPVSLEGPDGQPIGTFTPGPDDLDWREMGISEEEARRRLAEPREGFTTEQVLAHLRSL